MTGKRRRTCVRACVRTCSLTVAAADRRGQSRSPSWDRAPGGGGASGAQRILGAGTEPGRAGLERSPGTRREVLGSRVGGVEPHFVAAGVPGLRPQCRRHHGLPVGQAHGPRRQNGERAGWWAAGSRGKMATAGRARVGSNWGHGAGARLGGGGSKTCGTAEVSSRELGCKKIGLPQMYPRRPTGNLGGTRVEGVME